MRALLCLAAALSAPAQFYRAMPIPASNPLTPEKVALGKMLFQDKRLSADGSVSCATCHDPTRAFTDARTVSVGVFALPGDRHVPSLIGRGFGVASVTHPAEGLDRHVLPGG